jgi:membrane protein YqaA with SNARE-associated domain
MNSSPKQNIKKSKIQLLHQYYSYTGFYTFVKTSLKKAIFPTLIVFLLLWIVHNFVINFNVLFTHITSIPPEIFIAWADQTDSPIFYVSVLAILSYLGGIISFLLGKTISKLPSVLSYVESKMKKYLKMIRKWGGFLIVVGALLPIPFSITSITAGLIQYKFRNFLLFGLLRFVRFYLYAVVIFNVM